MDCNLKSQKMQLGFDVNKAGWCQAAARVIEEIGDGKIGHGQLRAARTIKSFLSFEPRRRRQQINMFDVYAALMDKTVKSFFTDSCHVFRVMDTCEYGSVDDLKQGNKNAWDAALDHAARLIACEFKDFDRTAAKRELHATLTRLLKSLRGGLCCCAKKGDGKAEFCGQPLWGHCRNQHKSLNKEVKEKKSWFFWTVPYLESQVWAGSFESPADVAEWAGDLRGRSPEMDQNIIDEIWGKAEEYMALEAPAMANKAWKRLPESYHNLVGQADTEGSCFLCMASISATMPDSRSFFSFWTSPPSRSSKNIQVCAECATRFGKTDE